ncbi:MAG TPA: TIGR03016 family PEP-CTERM system-associated outer membrane protein, partial [Usitatibacter sp.]|nr:TIGR03016 family PEP-CTERM system-associated outer membrane protein [Usitatibacter sp.]
LRYSSLDNRDSNQRFVDARARARASEGLGVEADVQVAQQNLDPLGPASTPDRPNLGANHVETRLLQAAPYARGERPGIAAYEAKAVASDLRSSGDALPTLRALEFDAALRSPYAGSLVRWKADARSFTVRPEGARALDDRRARATVAVRLPGELYVGAVLGYDATDFLGDANRSGSARGVGLAWNPSPRTRATAVFEHRFYGPAHAVDISWRTPRTAWRAASVRDLTILPNVLTPGASSAPAALMGDLLASAIADPEARAAAARRRLEESALGGAAPLSSSFLGTRPVEYREDELAGAFIGPRDTLTLRANRREQHARGPALAPGTAAQFEQDVRQTRYSAQWAHRLTPLSTLALEAAWLEARSLDDPLARRSRQRQLTARFNVRLGPRSTVAFGVRRASFEGNAGFDTFGERAVFALFTAQL